MKKNLEIDAADLTAILEGFAAKLDKMTEPDLIDLAARLKPAAKHIKVIDEYVKELVKDKLKHKDGNRLGGMFKAILKLVPIDRFQQAKFKEANPKLYLKYVEECTDERVTFEVR